MSSVDGLNIARCLLHVYYITGIFLYLTKKLELNLNSTIYVKSHISYCIAMASIASMWIPLDKMGT